MLVPLIFYARSPSKQIQTQTLRFQDQTSEEKEIRSYFLTIFFAKNGSHPFCDPTTTKGSSTWRSK